MFKKLMFAAAAAVTMTFTANAMFIGARLPDTSNLGALLDASKVGYLQNAAFSRSVIVSTDDDGKWKSATFKTLPGGITFKFDAKTQTATLSSKKVTAKPGWYYPVLSVTGAADGSVISRVCPMYVGQEFGDQAEYAALLKEAWKSADSIDPESPNQSTWEDLSAGFEKTHSGSRAIDKMLCNLRPKEAVSVKNLPPGVKLNAKWATSVDDETGETMTQARITGVPTKAGVYPVTVTEKVLQGNGKTKTLTSKFVMVVENTSSRYIRVKATEGGKVSVKSGVYAEGAVITAKATPGKGYVFAGWYAPKGGGETDETEYGSPFCSQYDFFCNRKEVDYRLATAKWCVTAEGVGLESWNGGMIAPEGPIVACFVNAEDEKLELANRQTQYDDDPESEGGSNFLGLRDTTDTYEADAQGFVSETTFVYDLRDPDACLDLAFVSGGISYAPITVTGLPKGFSLVSYDQQNVEFYTPTNNETNRKRQPAPGTYVVTATATAQSKYTMTRQIVIRVIDADYTLFAANVPDLEDFLSVRSGIYTPIAGATFSWQEVTLGSVPRLYPDLAALAADGWTFAVSGQPSGVKLSKDGVWSGAPTKAGTFVVKVTASRKEDGKTVKRVLSFVHEVIPLYPPVCTTYVGPYVAFAGGEFQAEFDGVATITLSTAGKMSCKLESKSGATTTLAPGKDALVQTLGDGAHAYATGTVFGHELPYEIFFSSWGGGIAVPEGQEGAVASECVFVLSSKIYSTDLGFSFPKFPAQTLDFSTVDKGSPLPGLTMNIKKNAKDDIQFVYKNAQGKTVQSGSAKMFFGGTGTCNGRPSFQVGACFVLKPKASLEFEGLAVMVALAVDSETGEVLKKSVGTTVEAVTGDLFDE